jgi:hypothetical protein
LYSLLVISISRIIIVTPTFVYFDFFFLANIPLLLGAIPILCIDLGSDLVNKYLQKLIWTLLI